MKRLFEIAGAIREQFRTLVAPKLAPRFGLDLRSVAVFRMGLGVLLLTDLFWRSLDLRAHYTDVGLMPRERLLGGWSSPLYYSFHNWGGDATSQALLFITAAVFALMLLVGYKTQLAAFMSWLLLVSLHGRNYLILQGGDDMVRVMLFWSIFLPLGARYSVDSVLRARLKPRELIPRRVFSLASIVIVLQLLAIYVVTAHLKSGPTWHQQGSVIHLVLHHHTFVTEFGKLFLQLPGRVLQWLTWGVWWLELLGPFLFFVPAYTHLTRTLQVLAFWSFHFGLFLCMELGPFPWVAIVSWSIILPSWFWDVPVYQLARTAGLRRRWHGFSTRLQAWVAEQHHWLRAPGKLPLPASRIAVFVLFVFASYTGYGTVYAAFHRGGVQGKQFDPLIVTRLYANWGMFAPNPPSTSGWFVTVARQVNGNEVDVWNDGQPVTFDPPELASKTYKRERWRKFSDNILSQNHAVVRPYFLGWLCTEWNESHPKEEHITNIELYHMAQTAHWPERGYGPLKKNLLQRHRCPAVATPTEEKVATQR